MPTTLGSHSPRLAAVRALLTKAGRVAAGQFAVAGRTMLEEAVGSQRFPEAVYVSPAALPSLSRLNLPDDRLFIVAEGALGRLSDLETPPGIVAVHRLQRASLEAVLSGAGPVLVLAGVADPGNAGTLLRSAEIFGCSGAIFAGSAVEPYNPKVVRATMGAIFRVPVATGSAAAVLAAAARRSYAVVVAERGGEPLPRARFRRRSLIVIGGERRGVEGWRAGGARTVAIPQAGAGDSLNAAVAGSIVLYAFSQQCDASK